MDQAKTVAEGTVKERAANIFAEVYEGAKAVLKNPSRDANGKTMFQLKTRIERLDELVKLDAPTKVVAVEMKLVMQAYTALMGW